MKDTEQIEIKIKNISNVSQHAKYVFKEEAEAIANLHNLLTDEFNVAVQIILETKGKVIVTGVGKSGLIGRKIAASLASTGTQSFFIHPTEALHGDLGMLGRDDTILAVTNSGETDEILRLVSFFKENKNKVISVTGNPNSTLALNSDAHLNVSVDNEVCPLNLAPTTSATAALVMGHALIVALMHLRSFKDENYAKLHPGGSLGKRLLIKVENLMQTSELPLARENTSLIDVISTISKSHFGLVAVLDDSQLKGVITDGDLRRTAQQSPDTFFKKKAKEVMNKQPVICHMSDSLDTAKKMMETHSINTLLVTENHLLIGLLKYKQVVNL